MPGRCPDASRGIRSTCPREKSRVSVDTFSFSRVTVQSWFIEALFQVIKWIFSELEQKVCFPEAVLSSLSLRTKLEKRFIFALLSINNYSEFRVKESTAAWTFTVKSLVENLYFFKLYSSSSCLKRGRAAWSLRDNYTLFVMFFSFTRSPEHIKQRLKKQTSC